MWALIGTVKSLMVGMALAKEQFYNVGNQQVIFIHSGPAFSTQESIAAPLRCGGCAYPSG